LLLVRLSRVARFWIEPGVRFRSCVVDTYAKHTRNIDIHYIYIYCILCTV
jgi:hypothetical protein